MNDRKKEFFASAVLIIIILGGIAYHFYSQEEQKESAPATNVQLALLYVVDSSDGQNYITVEHDDILNVTCWRGGMLSISCVPDNQLDPSAKQRLAELLNKSKLADDK